MLERFFDYKPAVLELDRRAMELCAPYFRQAEQVRDFAVQFVDRMEHQYVELMEEIQSTGNLSGVAVETIRAALADYKKEKLPGN